jgi:hypothetical protein
MKKTTSLVSSSTIALAVILGTATVSFAQAPPTKNIFVDVNFGAQPQSRSFSASSTPVVYNEVAFINSAQEVGGSGFFDIQGGYRVWEDVSVGLGWTKNFTTNGTAEVTGAIPHPLFYDTYVESTQTIEDLEHREQAVHILFMWTSPISDKMDASVSAGPSYVSVTQQLVTNVTVPAGTQTFTPVAGEESDSAWGFSFGGDVTYLVTPRIGVGAMLRYVKATADLPSAPDLDLAGFQFGGGVRFRF